MEWFAESRTRGSARCGAGVLRDDTSLAFIVAILVPLILSVAYLTLWERKLIGWMQIRLAQPRRACRAAAAFADVLKLLFKEIILPTNANKALPDRADPDDHAGDRGLGGDPVLARAGARGHQRGPALHHGAFFHGRIRRDRRRLGVELEVRLPRRDALGGADGVLRARHGLRARRGADGVAEPQPLRHRRRAGRRATSPPRGSPSCRGTGCRSRPCWWCTS